MRLIIRDRGEDSSVMSPDQEKITGTGRNGANTNKRSTTKVVVCGLTCRSSSRWAIRPEKSFRVVLRLASGPRRRGDRAAQLIVIRPRNSPGQSYELPVLAVNLVAFGGEVRDHRALRASGYNFHSPPKVRDLFEWHIECRRFVLTVYVHRGMLSDAFRIGS